MSVTHPLPLVLRETCLRDYIISQGEAFTTPRRNYKTNEVNDLSIILWYCIKYSRYKILYLINNQTWKHAMSKY